MEIKNHTCSNSLSHKILTMEIANHTCSNSPSHRILTMEIANHTYSSSPNHRILTLEIAVQACSNSPSHPVIAYGHWKLHIKPSQTHPVAVYWHWAHQSQHWPRCLVGQPLEHQSLCQRWHSTRESRVRSKDLMLLGLMPYHWASEALSEGDSRGDRKPQTLHPPRSRTTCLPPGQHLRQRRQEATDTPPSQVRNHLSSTWPTPETEETGSHRHSTCLPPGHHLRQQRRQEATDTPPSQVRYHLSSTWPPPELFQGKPWGDSIETWQST